MPNLNIIFPKVSKTNSAYTYADLHLDLNLQQLVTNEAAKKAQQVDISGDYDLGAIRNSLVNLFLTRPGDKILNPAFGLDLREFLFMPVSETVALLIKKAIAENIRIFETRITLQQLEVESDYDNQQYTINITVTIPSLQNKSLNLSGSINSQGYITFT